MSPRPARSKDFDEFARRSLFVAALVVFGVLLWLLRGVFLLIFASVLLAIAIRTLAVPFAQRTALGMSAAIGVVVFLLVVILSGTGLMLGAQLSDQLGELWTRLPEFAASAEQFIAQTSIGKTLVRLLPDSEQVFGGFTAGTALTAATTTLGVLANVLVVIFLGLFFAFTPTFMPADWWRCFLPLIALAPKKYWRIRRRRYAAGCVDNSWPWSPWA